VQAQGLGGPEQLDHVPGGLAHRLRALGEEQAGLVTGTAALQLPGRNNPG
jgi:hypothetical protein